MLNISLKRHWNIKCVYLLIMQINNISIQEWIIIN